MLYEHKDILAPGAGLGVLRRDCHTCWSAWNASRDAMGADGPLNYYFLAGTDRQADEGRDGGANVVGGRMPGP